MKKHNFRCTVVPFCNNNSLNLQSVISSEGVPKFLLAINESLEFKIGNYPEKCPVRIWKRDISLLIDLLISNNFSSMTFFCATRILRVIGRQSIRQSTNFFTDFLA